MGCGGLGSGRFWKSWNNVIPVSFCCVVCLVFVLFCCLTKWEKPSKVKTSKVKLLHDSALLGCDCSLCCASWFTVCMEWVTLDPALLVELPTSPCQLELLFLSSLTGLFGESPFLNNRWRKRVMPNYK